MVSLLESRTQRATAFVVALVLSAIGFLPLFGGPGYEHALASGLIVPSAAAIASALELSSAEAASRTPLACLARGMASGAGLALVAFATALAHGLRVGFCDFWGGALLFGLTAGMGAVCGGAWGALVAEGVRGQRRRRATAIVLALAGPLAGIGLSVLRFYATPIIFAFDPFFGYFSGALYDTVIDVRTELWSYRAGTLAALTSGVFAASAMGRNGAGRWIVRSGRRARACLAAALVVGCGAAAVAIEGPALGHWQTASTIAAALGGRIRGARCDVVYPDSLSAEQAALLLRDCEQELAADERVFDAHLSGRLTAFEFADVDQKRRLMGAAETSIAKPWRKEVYVQVSSFPHPILGHEIAHVVAGSFAPGPFHVGGGLLPNPGLIEGAAVAASPDNDELTAPQWARAMLDLGTLPRLKDLFSLGFLGENSAKSYTVAGAFVAWMLDRPDGPSIVRRWYGGASIEAMMGRDWSGLQDAFQQWLQTRSMPPAAAAYARARFERPSVWRRRCPHVVDALRRGADQCRDAHRFDAAIALYGAALARDEDNWGARFERAHLELRFGNANAGRDELARMRDDARAPQPWRDRAEEALADDDLVSGRPEDAERSYRAVAARTLDEDAARTLDVKGLSARDPKARQAIIDLLIGTPGRSVDPWLAALSLGQWVGVSGERPAANASAAGEGTDADVPPEGVAASEALARYLVGKNELSHEAWERAAATIDATHDLPAPTARVGRELLRARAVAACVLQDSAALTRAVRDATAPTSPFAGSAGGRRDALLRFAARCDPRLSVPPSSDSAPSLDSLPSSDSPPSLDATPVRVP